jgi:hypothetical protein
LGVMRVAVMRVFNPGPKIKNLTRGAISRVTPDQDHHICLVRITLGVMRVAIMRVFNPGSKIKNLTRWAILRVTSDQDRNMFSKHILCVKKASLGPLSEFHHLPWDLKSKISLGVQF